MSLSTRKGKGFKIAGHIVDIMCFALLLSSWLIVHGAPLSAALQPANYDTPVDNVTLIFYKKPCSSEGEAGYARQLLHSLRALSGELDGLDAIPDCGESGAVVCFASTRCPGKTGLLNHTAKRDTHMHSCSTIIYNEMNSTMSEENEKGERPTSLKVWGYGLLSVGIISLSGLFGGLMWPLMSSKYGKEVMRFLIGLAAGTLCATSTLQLIPQGFGMKEGDLSHLFTSVTLLGSLWILYMFEVLCKIIFHPKPAKESSTKKSVQCSITSTVELGTETVQDEDGLLSSPETVDTDISMPRIPEAPYFSSRSSLHQIMAKHMESHQHILIGGIAPVAWMIILGDSLHNFVDGMSIGAGFSQSLSSGTSISIAIAFEEFPHELGDFAILINSGMSIKMALLCNFASALTAFGGLFLGILLGDLEATTYIFAFSGGLFLYISLTDLFPELSGMVSKGLETSKANALVVLLHENCGILIGFILMYAVSAIPIFIG